MKHFLTLISLVFLSAAAFGQTFQYRPTAYTQPFVSTINSSAAAQAYLGIGSSTNYPLLSGTNVFSGTNTFAATRFMIPNQILYRTLFTTNSIFVASITNSTSSPTNDADYRKITSFLNLTLPPLCGTNSEVLFIIKFWPTNSEPNATGLALYLGDATNFVYAANNFASAPTAIATTGAGTSIFKNSRSMTNQFRMTAGAGSPPLTTWNTFTTSPGYNLANTSTNWSLRVGLFSANSANSTTNMWFEEVTIVEKVTN